MKFNDNKKIVDSLNKSLISNSSAIEYVEEELRKNKDILKFNPDDIHVQYVVENLEYINFCLKFLEKSYSDSLKRLGK